MYTLAIIKIYIKYKNRVIKQKEKKTDLIRTMI